MKLFIAILVLIFSLQSWTKADDIRDFQIEGMSIGDSLLDYMSENEINNSKRDYVKGREYYVVYKLDSLKTYEVVDIYLKSEDKSYKIRTLNGILPSDKKNKCLSKKKEIVKDIDQLFSSLQKQSDTKSHDFDKTGKSKQYVDQFNFDSVWPNNHIRVECVIWSNEIKRKHNYDDSLNIVVMTKEIGKWIESGYP